MTSHERRSRRAPASLRWRVVALVVIVLVPVTVFAVLDTVDHRSAALEQARDDLQFAAERGLSFQRELVAEARVLLDLLERQPAVQAAESPACDAELAHALRSAPDRYSTIVVADTDGMVVCSATPRDGPVNASDLAWFQRTVRLERFSLGDQQVGRITGLPIIVAGHPVRGDDGTLLGVLGAGLRLDWLTSMLVDETVGGDGRIALVDSTGDVLVAEDRSGQVVSDAALPFDTRTFVRTHELSDGVRRVDGSTGQWLVAGGTLDVPGSPHIVVAVPIASVLPPIDEAVSRDIVALLLAGVLAVGLGLTAAELGLVRPLRQVREAARRMEDGDLTARVPPDGPQELTEVADALNRAAGALQRYEEEREAFVADLVRAGEDERRALASFLHDDTVQSLVALAMRLSMLEDDLRSPDLRQRATELRRLVVEAGERLRSALTELRPPALERGDLTAALRAHLSSSLGDRIQWSVEGASTLPVHVAVTLFRVAQESVANAVRHGRASRIGVWWWVSDRQAFLTVDDDGSGFDLDTVTPRAGHVGLIGMRQRVRIAGGTLRLDATPDAGTRVEVSIPLNPAIALDDRAPGPGDAAHQDAPDQAGSSSGAG